MRPIAISLSPNTTKDDVVLSLKSLFMPWKWFDEESVSKLETEFKKYFGGKYYPLAVNSGRSAEYLILQALGIGRGDEVLIQAFTCVAVPNSISWLGAKPVFVDIDDEYNLDVKDLERKITKKTKAVIMQHTFGIPADVKRIKTITKKHNIYLVEDCAHSLGAEYRGSKIGTFGAASFFSFGRDKVISSVFGGMIMTPDRDLYSRIKAKRDSLPRSPAVWTKKQLLHPIVFHGLVLPFYNLGLEKLTLGKLILYIFQKLRLVSKPVYKEELFASMPDIFPRKMPGVLSKLVINQLDKLDLYNKHRRKIASLYFNKLSGLGLELPTKTKGAIWLRFPVKVNNPEKIYSYAKKKGILLGDWYSNVVDPKCNLDVIGYKKGDSPNAERLSKSTLNLPTYPTLNIKQAHRVIQLIKQCQNIKLKR